MDRLEIIRGKINELLNNITDINLRQSFYIHSYGVSSIAALLAARRGLNRELAAISGLLHDIALIISGAYETHAEKGAELAKNVLSELFNNEEIETITNAIRYHTDIEKVNSPYDEVLKDADILQPYFYDISEPAFPPAIPRLKKMMSELAIPIDFI